MIRLYKRLFGLIMLALLFWLANELVYPACAQALSSQGWEVTNGNVTQNELRANTGKKRNLYQLDFTYQYTVESTKFDGNSRFFSFNEPTFQNVLMGYEYV